MFNKTETIKFNDFLNKNKVEDVMYSIIGLLFVISIPVILCWKYLDFATVAYKFL